MLTQVSNGYSAEQGLGAGSNGTVSATGGGNMDLSGVLVLCERADDDPYRVFDGRYPNSLTTPFMLSVQAVGLCGLLPVMHPGLA